MRAHVLDSHHESQPQAYFKIENLKEAVHNVIAGVVVLPTMCAGRGSTVLSLQSRSAMRQEPHTSDTHQLQLM